MAESLSAVRHLVSAMPAGEQRALTAFFDSNHNLQNRGANNG